PLAALRRRWQLEEPDARAGRRVRIAQWAVHRVLVRESAPGPDPAHVRASVFRAAAAGMARDQALAAAARQLALTPATIAAALFADLQLERAVAVPAGLDPGWLSLAINRAIAQSLVATAERARLQLWGA